MPTRTTGQSDHKTGNSSGRQRHVENESLPPIAKSVEQEIRRNNQNMGRQKKKKLKEERWPNKKAKKLGTEMKGLQKKRPLFAPVHHWQH